MSGEYDLVVIGGGAAGVAAAMKAAKLNARVVLVEQGISAVPSLGVSQQVLRHASRSRQQRPLPFSPASPSAPDRAALEAQLRQWTAAATARLEGATSPAILASLGVEVISGQGAFYRRPSLGFEVQGRSLRSRAYFLAPSCYAKTPVIDGLRTTGFLDTNSFNFSDLGPAQQVMILGKEATSVELAQALARLGLTVTLATSGRLLPQEDPEAVQLLQAHLETEGVRILTQAEVTQVRQIQDQKWVQVGDRAIETDEILVETTLQPDLEPLNLAAAQVRWNADGIALNDKLQTTNPRIYATSPQSYSAAQVATCEANRAIENALGASRSRLNFSTLPQVVYTEPELVRVGLTEPQAIQQFGKDVEILRQSCKILTQAQIQDETSGFCKLVVGRGGVILGAHLVGKTASELIAPIALAMQQNLKIEAIANLVLPSPSFSELAQRTAAEWQGGRSRHIWQQLLRALKLHQK